MGDAIPYYKCREHGVLPAGISKDRRSKKGWKVYCKPCNRLNHAAYRLKSAQFHRDRAKAWYAANRERKLAWMREYRLRTIEERRLSDRVRYLRNKSARLELQRGLAVEALG